MAWLCGAWTCPVRASMPGSTEARRRPGYDEARSQCRTSFLGRIEPMARDGSGTTSWRKGSLLWAASHRTADAGERPASPATPPWPAEGCWGSGWSRQCRATSSTVPSRHRQAGENQFPETPQSGYQQGSGDPGYPQALAGGVKAPKVKYHYRIGCFPPLPARYFRPIEQVRQNRVQCCLQIGFVIEIGGRPGGRRNVPDCIHTGTPSIRVVRA